MCSHKYVDERDMLPWNDEDKPGFLFDGKKGDNKWKLQLVEQNKRSLETIRTGIVTGQGRLHDAAGELEAQQKSFGVFLNDQGSAKQTSLI